MALVPFNPPPGINSDDTTFAAEGRWADGNNVRFHEGRAQPIGGWVQLVDLSGSITPQCRVIHAIDRDPAHVAFGFAGPSATASKLYIGTVSDVLAGVAPTDVTPVAFSSESWSLASWGTTLLASPRLGTLYEQTGASTATEVTQAPDRIDAGILVTNERQVLAFACNEEGSGTHNPRCIRGCNIEDYTDWTTSATNNAFEHILDDDSQIIGARQVGAYVAVWTYTGLHLGQFIGDPGQTYRFDKVATNCGLIGPYAVAIVRGRAWWVSPDGRIWTWAPGDLPAALECPIGKDFTDNLLLGQPASSGVRGGFYTHTLVITKFNEIRFYYLRNSASIWAYIAINVETGQWYRGNYGSGNAGPTAALESPLFLDGNRKSSILSVSSSRIINIEETGHSGTTASPYSWYIQSADISLDNSQRRAMATRCIPDFEDQVGDVSLTLTVRDRPQSSATTKGPYTLSTTTTKKDFRASGKIFTVKFSGADGTYARLGKPLFDVVPLGER